MSTTPQTAEGPGAGIRWLLVNIAASGSSASSPDAWRRLRALGAHYLQPAVCLLPERPETHEAVVRVVERVRRVGGSARMFPIGLLPRDEERDVIAAFSAERSDEYDQVVDRTREFLGEISMKRDHSRASYTEVEESQVDLRRLQRWLASIRKRDYFDAPGYAQAAEAVAACERLLAEFEAEAYAVEIHPTDEDLARAPWRRRLRALGSPAGG
jgi:hypothetical protein